LTHNVDMTIDSAALSVVSANPFVPTITDRTARSLHDGTSERSFNSAAR